MSGIDYVDDLEETGPEVDRSDTGIRVLLTLLFVLVASVAETVIGLIVLFELVWTLVTRQPPGVRVRELANRIIAYYYRIGRYLTFNDARVPYPFSDFPEPLEPSRWAPSPRESESLGLPARGEDDEE